MMDDRSKDVSSSGIRTWRGGTRALNTALAAAVSVGLGLGPAMPALAVPESGQAPESAQLEQAWTASGGGQEAAGAPSDSEGGQNGATGQDEAVVEDGSADAKSSVVSAGSAEGAALEGEAQDAASSSAGAAGSAEPAPAGLSAGQRDAAAVSRESAVDLGSLWKGQAGGVDAALSITEGGTYRLAEDLDVNSMLEIDAPGADVVIDLGASTLTSRSEAASCLVKATSCASLTIVGDYSARKLQASGDASAEAGAAQLVMAGGSLSHAVESSADALSVRNVGILLRADDAHVDLENLGSSGVHALRGTVAIEACSVVIDHGNQTQANFAGSRLEGCPRGICLERDVAQARVGDTEVCVTGSPAVEPRDGSDGLTSCENAYALFSESAGQVVVSGGAFKAISAHGNATALYGARLALEPGADGSAVRVEADAGNIAVGVRSAGARAVTLDAPVEFSPSAALFPAYRAALASDFADAFVLGPRFSSSGATVLIGTDLAASNADGVRVATFAAEVTAEARWSMAGMLANGLEAGACSVVLEGDGLEFRLDARKAPACIVSASGEERACASVAEAVASMGSGETVKLLADAGSVSVERGTARNEFAIDLNGHSVSTLEVSSRAHVRVFSSDSALRGSIDGFSSEIGGAVSHSGSGTLELAGIDVASVSRASAVTALAVSGSGDVVLEDVNVRAVSQTSTARGIDQTGNGSSVTVRGGSVAASSTEPGVAVYGVSSSASSASLSVEDCAVCAESVDATTGGIDVRGALELANSTVEARTERAASTVWAVRTTGDSARASVASCTLRAACGEDASDGAYWCLMAGAAVPSNAGAWTLDGQCSFESANDTHLGFSGTPVVLGASFGTSSRLVAYGTGLDNGVAFVPGEGAGLAGFAGRIAACAGSPYEGCPLVLDGAGALRWRESAVVENVSTGEWFSSLGEALSQAQAHQTLRLTADCTVREQASADVPVNLDLNGRTLRVRLSGSSLGAALSFKGEGESSVKNGTVEMAVDAGAAALARDGRASVVSVGADAALSLEGVAVSLEFSSETAGAGDVEAVGADAGSGSVSLTDGSSVRVRASGVHPAAACGIAVSGGTNAGAAAVARGCSVEVENSARRQRSGSIVDASSSGSLGSARLLRVDLEEGTELHEEIQCKFKERALFDSQGDAAGYVYGARLYYAAPLELDDGSYVWAFSDPVPATASLDPQNITATRFYVQSRYDRLPEANGILAGGPDAVVQANGAVSAESDEGDACALRVDGDDGEEAGRGCVTVGSAARLSARGGTEACLRDAGSFDLRAEFGPAVAGASRLVYPSTGNYRTVRRALPEAAAVGGDAASAVRVASGASLSESGGDGSEEAVSEVPDFLPESVEVTFANLRDGFGGLLPDETRVQAYGSTLGEGGAVPVPSDYARDGVAYRFVGWSTSFRSSGVRALNPETIEEGLVLDKSVGADGGSVVLTAEYVPVREGEHLATFCVDGLVEACSVPDGRAPSFSEAQRGSLSTVPTKFEQEEGTTYRFVGWRTEEGAVCAGGLPRADGDCSFTAVFAETPETVQAEFHAWQDVDGSLAYAVVEQDVAYGEPLDEAAAKVAKPGDAVCGETEVYEFLGWSPRQSDSAPLYTEGLPSFVEPVMVGSSSRTSSSALYGVYRSRERVLDVTFVVDGQTYAAAEDVSAGRTVNGAFQATGAARPADKGENERFRGWALGSPEGTLLMGAVKTLAGLTEGEDPVVLYAVFGAGPTADEQAGVPEGENASGDGGEGASGDVGLNGGGTGASPNARGGALNAAFGSAGALRNTASASPSPASAEPAARGGEEGSADAAQDGRPAAQEAAGQAAEGEDADAEAAGFAQGADSARAGNTASFFAAIAAVVCLGASLLWRAWRNRRLDAEDDFYEPDAEGDRGERVTF